MNEQGWLAAEETYTYTYNEYNEVIKRCMRLVCVVVISWWTMHNISDSRKRSPMLLCDLKVKVYNMWRLCLATQSALLGH